MGLLRGSFVFIADLVRELNLPVEVDFLEASSYGDEMVSSKEVRILKDLRGAIEEKDVLLVEDIVDTGLTSAFLIGELQRRNPASVSLCTLVDRPAHRVVPVPIDHTGVQIEDRFVIGYGLDHEGRYRNLQVLAIADPAVLAEDPDAYVEPLYGA